MTKPLLKLSAQTCFGIDLRKSGQKNNDSKLFFTAHGYIKRTGYSVGGSDPFIPMKVAPKMLSNTEVLQARPMV